MARGATATKLRALRKKYGLGEFKKARTTRKAPAARRRKSSKRRVLAQSFSSRSPFWGRY